MTVNAFKNANQEFLPIRRYESTSALSTSTPFITLGDEVLVSGVWYKATTYSKANGYGWQKLTGQNSGGTSSGITWEQITTSQIMAPNFGYILQNDFAPITLSLPTTCGLGDVMLVIGDLGCAGLNIAQSAGQQMVLSPTVETTLGTAGGYSVPSPAQSLTLTFVCTVPNTRWVVTSNYGGYVT